MKNKKILDFKRFESNNETKYLDESDVREIFSEITDMDFDLKYIYIEEGTYQVEIKCEMGQYNFSYNKKSKYSQGYTDLLSIDKKINFLLEELDYVKQRLISMGYYIGVFIDFHLEYKSIFLVKCNIQHSDLADGKDDILELDDDEDELFVLDEDEYEFNTK